MGCFFLGGGGNIQSAQNDIKRTRFTENGDTGSGDQNGSKRGHILLEMGIWVVGTKMAVREDRFYWKWG